MQSKQFRIGELAKKLNVQTFVIRFWEKEFNISPARSEGQQRFYTKKELALFTRIKELLYEQKLTIAGAKKQLAQPQPTIVPSIKAQKNDQKELSNTMIQELLIIREQLIKLREHL